MKLLTSRVLPAALAVALLLPASPALLAADPAKAAAKAPDLQVQVDVPPSWQPFLMDDIAEALGRVLSDSFKRRGYAGTIQQVGLPDAAKPDLPLLTVRLHEWRISRTGNAECTLTGTLRAGGKEHDLGLVSYTDLSWIQSRGRFGVARDYAVADAYEDAAGGAMRELFKRVAATAAVPGLAEKSRK